jgi:hypothetical protein
VGVGSQWVVLVRAASELFPFIRGGGLGLGLGDPLRLGGLESSALLFVLPARPVRFLECARRGSDESERGGEGRQRRGREAGGRWRSSVVGSVLKKRAKKGMIIHAWQQCARN